MEINFVIWLLCTVFVSAVVSHIVVVRVMHDAHVADAKRVAELQARMRPVQSIDNDCKDPMEDIRVNGIQLTRKSRRCE